MNKVISTAKAVKKLFMVVFVLVLMFNEKLNELNEIDHVYSLTIYTQTEVLNTQCFKYHSSFQPISEEQ